MGSGTIQPATIDNYMDSNDPYSDNGNVNTLQLYNNGSAKKSSMLRFDVSSLGIPAGATIDVATMSLYVTGNNPVATKDSVVYEILRKNWESAWSNWSWYKVSTAWTTAGCGSTTDDYSDTVKSGTVTISAVTSGWVDYNIKDILTHCLSDHAGIVDVIVKATSTSSTTISIASSNHATTSIRPKIYVVWTPLATGPAHVKKFMGVAIANVKKANGVAPAHIKKLEGVG
jgi:hypothetical protein